MAYIFFGRIMRYFYDRQTVLRPNHGEVYKCNHPLYNRCTLYTNGDRGIAVIQQRFNRELKYSWWSSIDLCLVDDIYNAEGFNSFFEENATEPDENGLYFTVEVRKLMWALRMKPLKREYWEK